MGTQNLTEDILTTTVCIVEDNLNQRPLISVSNDKDSYKAITSNHFLIGSSGLEKIRIYSKESEDHRLIFIATQKISNQIWRIYQKKYTSMHLAINKWLKNQKTQFQHVDLVWIVHPQVFTDNFH